jgi:hypothetical protein
MREYFEVVMNSVINEYLVAETTICLKHSRKITYSRFDHHFYAYSSIVGSIFVNNVKCYQFNVDDNGFMRFKATKQFLANSDLKNKLKLREGGGYVFNGSMNLWWEECLIDHFLCVSYNYYDPLDQNESDKLIVSNWQLEGF